MSALYSAAEVPSSKTASAVALIVKFALLILKVKSWFWSGLQVDAFCDLNKTPAYGCSEIFLLVPIIFSPISEMYASYFKLLLNTTIAYSPGCK